MHKTIKILFLASNPKDTCQLRLGEEMRAIDQALREAEFRGNFDIEQQWAVRAIDLQGYLLRHKPDIVHFSGHGSESNEIILEDTDGNSKPVPNQALSKLFSVLKDNIRCVILNACYSERQAHAIAQSIDCVIGMSKAIGDSAAISFSIAFYQGLGYGRDVKTAFDLGCLQINLVGLNEQNTPKLLAIKSDPQKILFVNKLSASVGSQKIEPQTSFSILGKLSKEEIYSILNHYKSMISINPEDGESYYSLALCYLQLKLYDLAIKNFSRAIELIPEHPDTYYYYALSLIRGRRPKTLSLKEVKLIEEYLEASMRLDDQQAKYFYLAAILKFEYYKSNGLIVTPPDHDKLIKMAKDKKYDPWEIERLLKAILLRDEWLISAIHRN